MGWVYFFLFAPIPIAYLACEVYDWILRGADSLEEVGR